MALHLVILLGLTSDPSDAGFQPANHAPLYLIANWWYAYCTLSIRFEKISLGIDHNSSPREDLHQYGPAAVQAGKLSSGKLAMLRRRQAAHENSVEGYPLIVAAVCLATSAGVPNVTINRACLAYTVSRLLFGYAYIRFASDRASIGRTVLWWCCNVACFTGLVAAWRIQ